MKCENCDKEFSDKDDKEFITHIGCCKDCYMLLHSRGE